MSQRTEFRTCPLCEAICGLEITATDTEVIRVRGDRADVFSKGFICPKGSAVAALHTDPDRLRVPMVRDRSRGGWREVTWPEAFAATEERMMPVLERHGREALATYMGNPNAHNISLLYYGRQLGRSLATRNGYSAGTVDQITKQVSTALMFGTTLSIPIPDLDRTDYLILMGANPAASNGSLLTAPDVMGRLDAIQQRGGKVVVIDPRRTRTAERASEHHFIRPATDSHLLMAMTHVLFAEGLVDLGHLADHTNGVEEVRRIVAGWPPERVAEVCGIDAADIRRLARELSAAPTAAVYARIGTCTQEFGTLAGWLVDVLNVLTGNLDRPGGALFPRAFCGQPNSKGNPDMPRTIEWGRWHTRVRGAPEVMGQLPAACLAEEIDTPGDGRIRALVTIAGNPALAIPDSERLQAALPALDCMISVDNYINETTQHADVILPGESHLCQPHFSATLYQLAVRHVAKWSDPVFPPDPDRPREWEIMLILSSIFAGRGTEVDTIAADDAIISARIAKEVADEWSPVFGRDPDELFEAMAPAVGPERVVDWQIRTGPYGDAFSANPDGWTLARLKQHPHGIDLGPLESRVPEVLRTLSGQIELAPDYVVADVARLETSLSRDWTGMVLVGRRNLRTNNSWMHNVGNLIAGREQCSLLVHPDDAARFGVVDGGPVRVVTAGGEVVATAEVSDEMMPGTVSLPHGWGHDQPGTRLSVAATRPGVNSNILADPSAIEPLTGNAMVNGIPVTLSPA